MPAVAIASYGLTAWMIRRWEDHAFLAMAKKLAADSGKPILIIGPQTTSLEPGEVQIPEIPQVLPFKDGEFGAAFSSSGIELAADAERALAEIARVAAFAWIAAPDPWYLRLIQPGRRWAVVSRPALPGGGMGGISIVPVNEQVSLGSSGVGGGGLLGTLLKGAAFTLGGIAVKYIAGGV